LHFDTTMLILPFIFLNHPKHLFEVGWMIARKYWGCGFATESGQVAIALGNHTELCAKFYQSLEIAGRLLW
jgi:RimJ/RimL family protein N-acetyltransferase